MTLEQSLPITLSWRWETCDGDVACSCLRLKMMRLPHGRITFHARCLIGETVREPARPRPGWKIRPYRPPRFHVDGAESLCRRPPGGAILLGNHRRRHTRGSKARASTVTHVSDLEFPYLDLAPTRRANLQPVGARLGGAFAKNLFPDRAIVEEVILEG
jgi:hypothetical protein